MRVVSVICLLFVCSAFGGKIDSQKQLKSNLELVNKINAKATTWKAENNKFSHLEWEELRKLTGALPVPQELKEKMTIVDHTSANEGGSVYPNSFDAREKWPNCTSISEIRNQGGCGSCWAFAAVEVMTDRECIFSNGERNFHYSANDVVSCCKDCGSGCSGGWSEEVFKYWRSTGVVSGGPYNSSEGCRPYEIPDDEYHHTTPECVQECRKGYESTYSDDLHYGSEAYQLAVGEDNMIAELNKNGPFAASFLVYMDFYNYKNGVYQHTVGDNGGGHAIKIIGYGEEENGVKYWLCSNSWGNDWGDKGFFKILRGNNECDIESRGLSAGKPKL